VAATVPRRRAGSCRVAAVPKKYAYMIVRALARLAYGQPAKDFDGLLAPMRCRGT
jgi:hypothetical protein